MSTDISVESRSICRPRYRSRGAQNTHDPTKVQLSLGGSGTNVFSLLNQYEYKQSLLTLLFPNENDNSHTSKSGKFPIQNNCVMIILDT